MPILLNRKTTLILTLIGRALLMAGSMLSLSACTSNLGRMSTPEVVTVEQPAAAETPSWRYVRFRLRRGESAVNSFLDPLIANEILDPVIVRYGEGMELWRFHRRWPRDATGHQFSFIFFATEAVAVAVSEALRRAPLLERLRADGHLVEFRIDEADPDRATDPAATSDASWPPEIQHEWPKFIMGASRMWLGLVQSEVAKHDELGLYERYQNTEDALEKMWFSEANHAFFHHLSALFGYKPVEVRVIRRDVMTF